jgi:hypothetical protein
MDRNGWAFHKHIGEAYGNVVKINGTLGVSRKFDSLARI